MTRSIRLAALGAVLALAVGTVAPSDAQQPATVTADKEGWWTQTGRVAPTNLPTTVPDGAIAVSSAGEQTYSVAALGIVLDADKGSTVQSFTLTLKEAEGTGAQQGADGAAIVACPIVDFFAGDYAGAFEDAPAADCEVASAEGVRGDDGTWRFDLRAIADAWLDPFGTIAVNGVRFDPDGGSFQVSWTGMEDATFDVAITPPVEDPDPFDSSTTTMPGGFTGSAPAAGGPSDDFDVVPPPSVDDPTATTIAGDSTDGEAGDEVAVDDEPAASREGDVAGNLPVGVVLLVALALAGASAVMLTLGPLARARPAAARRSGGVSRALEARAGALVPDAAFPPMKTGTRT